MVDGGKPEDPFVWFDLRTKDAATARGVYEQLFRWDVAEVSIGAATVTMVGGEKPWASVVPERGEHLGWFRTSRSGIWPPQSRRRLS
jgi:predicted enzyme related to lactoylglutathione lyase